MVKDMMIVAILQKGIHTFVIRWDGKDEYWLMVHLMSIEGFLFNDIARMYMTLVGVRDNLIATVQDLHLEQQLNSTFVDDEDIGPHP